MAALAGAGLVSCAALALSLPLPTVLLGTGSLLAAVALRGLLRRRGRASRQP